MARRHPDIAMCIEPMLSGRQVEAMADGMLAGGFMG